LRSARGVVRVATVLSVLPAAIDPLVAVLLRVFVADEPAAVEPGVVFMLGELVPVAAVPRDVVPGPLSPDWDDPPVPLADEPDVPPLVAPELADPDPVAPELADPDPVAPEPVDPELAPVPALPELPPVCACARPISATAAIVASEVTIFDMVIS
jgi:hypothetical protein